MEQPRFNPDKELDAYHARPDLIRFPAAELSEELQELTAELRLDFQTAVREAMRLFEHIPDAVKQEAVNRAYDLPTVEIFDTSDAIQKRLRDLQIDQQTINRLKPDEIIMTIHLPDPMRVPFAQADQLEHADFWRELYYAGTQALWNAAEQFGRDHALSLERINPAGRHDLDKGGYYYIWHFSPQGREPLIPESEDEDWEDFS